MEKRKILERAMEPLNLTLTDKQELQLLKYYDILLEWNSFMNLTTIIEFNEVVDKHFIDSLILKRMIELKEQTVIDIGTGAGFPGIPLKILYPDLKITLLDSLNKRIKFLDHVIEILELENIKTIHGRAEEVGQNSCHRAKYDMVVSRAVANLSTLSEYCLPLVAVGGYFIPYKSGKMEEELNCSTGAIKTLGGILEKVEAFNLPGTDMKRSLLLIKKVKPTPKQYPRLAGKPSKEPI